MQIYFNVIFEPNRHRKSLSAWSPIRTVLRKSTASVTIRSHKSLSAWSPIRTSSAGSAEFPPDGVWSQKPFGLESYSDKYGCLEGTVLPYSVTKAFRLGVLFGPL